MEESVPPNIVSWVALMEQGEEFMCFHGFLTGKVPCESKQNSV